MVLTHPAGTHGLQDGSHAVGHGRAGGTEQGKKHFLTLPVDGVRPNPQVSVIAASSAAGVGQTIAKGVHTVR